MNVLVNIKGHFSGAVEWVDSLPEGETPDEEKVKTYYGSSAPKGAFRANQNKRLIFKKPDGSFIVMPATNRNYSMYRFLG